MVFWGAYGITEGLTIDIDIDAQIDIDVEIDLDTVYMCPHSTFLLAPCRARFWGIALCRV